MRLQAARPRDIENVQALRAVAALLVAIGHGAHSGALPAKLLALLSCCAYAGVDIFFVISGFIVSQAAFRAGSNVPREGRLAPAFEFACRRFFRIFPLYWAALAVAIVLGGWIHIAPAGWPPTPVLAMASLTSMWITPLSTAWTLAFEVYFYAVLTVLILVAGRLIDLAIGIWMATQLLWIFASHTGWLNWDVGSNALVLEFGLGWLVSLIVARSQVAPLLPVGLATLSFWGTGMWLTADRGLLLPAPRLATFGVASAFLLYTALGLERNGRRAPRWLQRIGDASYSIYLWHLIIFGALYALHPAPGPALFIAAVGGLLVCGFISHALIEVPAQRLGSKVVRRFVRPPALP